MAITELQRPQEPAARASRAEATGPRHAAPTARGSLGGLGGLRGLGGHAAALAFLSLLVPLHRSWAVQVLLVPLLLIVPGVILLRALRIPGRAVATFPAYVPCASIVVLLASGLAVDIAGPWVGIAAPLRTGPVLASLDITCLALLAASATAPSYVAIPWRALSRPARFAWPLILPLLAAAGALRLNSGHGNSVAVIALCACTVVGGTAVLLSSRLDKTLLMFILYAAELALMWSFSLRGNLVYGFDIATEYHDLHQTVLTGIWHSAHPGDAYGAMLSVTVMPAQLHFLTGVPDLLVLKVVYPAISAVLPVAVFGLARRILSRRWAFAAAALIVMQTAFAQELPAVARQEIALVLFAALVMVMLDTRLYRRSQWSLAALLAVAMVLAHYSTSYVALILIGLMLPMQWLVSWFRAVPRASGAVAVAFAAALASAFLWYGPVTHAGSSGLRQLAQTVGAQGFNLLPNHAPGSGLLATYLQGNNPTPATAQAYDRFLSPDYARNDPYILPLPDHLQQRYTLRDSAAQVPAVKWRAGYDAVSLGSLLVQQLVNVLGAIGALLIVLRRRASVVAYQVGLLALATLIFLAIIRLSGTLAAAYNQERALLQATTVLSVTLFWSVERLAGQRKGRQAGILALAAAALTVLFISTSGLVSTVLGGGAATNLANSGEDFERFYRTTPELASAQWLGHKVQPGQLVYADRYAQLPLAAMTGISRGLFTDVTPLTLNQHAWVYASRSNIVDKRARALFGDHTVTYVFPVGYLDDNYDIVYTDGSSEVFHR